MRGRKKGKRRGERRGKRGMVVKIGQEEEKKKEGTREKGVREE